MRRGEIFRLRSSSSARGHEQKGARYGVIVQADELLVLSTVLLAPTSTSALPASFRPGATIAGAPSRILVEQTAVHDLGRLGRSAGHLEAHELQSLDEALSMVLGL